MEAITPAPAAEPDKVPGLPGPVLLRRALLVLATTLLVARPLVLGEEPGLTTGLADPWGMVLTLLWLVVAAGWAAWRFWLRPRSRPDGTLDESPAGRGGDGPPPQNWYGGLAQAALLATVALVFVSAEAAARYKFPARMIAWEWLGLFAAFFVVRQLAVTPAEQRGLFAVVLAGAVSLAGQGMYQRFVELPANRRLADDPDAFRAVWEEESPGEEADEGLLEQLRLRARQNNIYGPYAHPNSYAGYLVLWLPGLVGAAVVCWRAGAPKWQTIAAAGCAILGAAALWLTHSRGAMLGLALAGMATGALVWRRTLRTHLLLTLAGLVVLVGLAYGAWRGGLLTTGVGKDAGVVSQRLQYWRATWQMILERPWLGVGPGNFGATYPRFMPPDAEEKIKAPHNFLLEMWASCGVFALLALLAAVAVFFSEVVRGLSGGTAGEDSPPRPPAQPPELRGEFYLGGMFGLLLGFVLRANELTADSALIAETWSAAIRSVVWFAAYGLLERVAWDARGRVLALATGVAALLLNLCVSDGIGFSSVAGPLWVAVALALNSSSLRPVAFLSRPGPAQILPLPILICVALGFGAYVVYPVLAADGLMRQAVDHVAQLRRGTLHPTNREADLRKNVIGRLEEAVRLTPGDARLHVQLAKWYGQLWEMNLWRTQVSDPKIAEKAIAHGMLATQLDPDGSEGYLIQYNLRMRFGTLNEALAHSDRDRGVLFKREKEQTARRQYQEAARVLEEHLPHDPTEAKLHQLLAEALFKAGDRTGGCEEAETALRLDEGVTYPARRLTDRQRKQARTWLEAVPES